MRRRAVLILACLAATGAQLDAQGTPAASDTGRPTWYASNWTRAELWHFFEPPPGGGNNEYAYPVNRLQVGLRHSTARFDVAAALQYVQFGGLPADAVGPGPLGLGAVYFAHAGRSDSHQIYLRYLNVRVKNVLPGLSLQAGRMPYSSGGEVASGDPKLDNVRRQRIDSRLVGEFEWSIYQRGFDGVRADYARPRWASSFVAFRPTQGGFEDAAGASMRKLTVLGGSATATRRPRRGAVQAQAFAFRYDDSRQVAARPDNSGRPATRLAVDIGTVGGTVLATSNVTEGRQWDVLLWAAVQRGSWFGQTHRASSVAAEVGHQWTGAPWQPWIRTGLLRASGDRDPDDARHGTFFQMLPTVRRYSQTTANSQMNSQDAFVSAQVRPTSSVTARLDLRRLALVSATDLWYFGSGATQSRGTLFGFSTRPSNGSRSLGTAVEGSVDVSVMPRWSIGTFVGALRGGDVIRRSFAGHTMLFGFVENAVEF